MNRRREEDKRKAKEESEAEIAELKAAGKVGSKNVVTKSISQRTKKQSKSGNVASPRQKPKSPRGPVEVKQELPVRDSAYSGTEVKVCCIC